MYEIYENFRAKNKKNWEIAYLKWRIESNCSWKKALCFNNLQLDNPEGHMEVEST